MPLCPACLCDPCHCPGTPASRVPAPDDAAVGARVQREAEALHEFAAPLPSWIERPPAAAGLGTPALPDLLAAVEDLDADALAQLRQVADGRAAMLRAAQELGELRAFHAGLTAARAALLDPPARVFSFDTTSSLHGTLRTLRRDLDTAAGVAASEIARRETRAKAGA